MKIKKNKQKIFFTVLLAGMFFIVSVNAVLAIGKVCNTEKTCTANCCKDCPGGKYDLVPCDSANEGGCANYYMCSTAAATSSSGFQYSMLETLPGFFAQNSVMTDFPALILAIYKFGIWTVGIAGLFMLVVGGFVYMTSAGNNASITTAKGIITDALLGIVAAMAAYLVMYVINPDLTSINIAFTAANVEDNYSPTSGGGSATGVSATGGENPNATSAGNDKLNASYGNAIKSAANDTGVDCNLIKAVIFAESGGNPNATSGNNAQGLMQIVPTTAAGLGCSGGCNMYDGNTAIKYGAKYLQQLKKTACNGSANNSVCNIGTVDFVIAAYNAGPGRNAASDNCSRKMTSWQCTVNKKLGQTRNYVQRVKANYEKLKSMPGC